MLKRTLFSLFALLALTGRAQADTIVKRLAPGVTLTQEIDRKTPRYLRTGGSFDGL